MFVIEHYDTVFREEYPFLEGLVLEARLVTFFDAEVFDAFSLSK